MHLVQATVELTDGENAKAHFSRLIEETMDVLYTVAQRLTRSAPRRETCSDLGLWRNGARVLLERNIEARFQKRRQFIESATATQHRKIAEVENGGRDPFSVTVAARAVIDGDVRSGA